MTNESEQSASASAENVAFSGSAEAARLALRNGPRGALVIASVSIVALLAGWLAFYFLLFIPRGSIG